MRKGLPSVVSEPGPISSSARSIRPSRPSALSARLTIRRFGAAIGEAARIWRAIVISSGRVIVGRKNPLGLFWHDGFPSERRHLDGASDFYALRHGGPYRPLNERPSDYFLRQVRVAALPYEMPNRLVPKGGEQTFMVGSDWPHAEGVADPRAAADRAAHGLSDDGRTGLLGANAAWLLGL